MIRLAFPMKIFHAGKMGLDWKAVILMSLCCLLGGAVHGVTLSSPAFVDGGVLPDVYTAHESDLSPPFLWENAPKTTQCYVLIVDEPQDTGPAIVHWILYNIPVRWSGLPENVLTLMGEGNDGPIAGCNSWAKTDWVGATNESTVLRFRLFALKQYLYFKETPHVEAVLTAMDKLVLSYDEIVASVGD